MLSHLQRRQFWNYDRTMFRGEDFDAIGGGVTLASIKNSARLYYVHFYGLGAMQSSDLFGFVVRHPVSWTRGVNITASFSKRIWICLLATLFTLLLAVISFYFVYAKVFPNPWNMVKKDAKLADMITRIIFGSLENHLCCWFNNVPFSAGSLLLCLWGVFAILIYNIFLVDLRSGLVSQEFEKPFLRAGDINDHLEVHISLLRSM